MVKSVEAIVEEIKVIWLACIMNGLVCAGGWIFGGIILLSLTYAPVTLHMSSS